MAGADSTRQRMAPRISRVSLHAAAANADLLIETSAAGMQLCEPSPSVALRVRGQIRSPLDIRLPLRPVRYIEINVEGSAARDSCSAAWMCHEPARCTHRARA